MNFHDGFNKESEEKYKKAFEIALSKIFNKIYADLSLMGKSDIALDIQKKELLEHFEIELDKLNKK